MDAEEEHYSDAGDFADAAGTQSVFGHVPPQTTTAAMDDESIAGTFFQEAGGNGPTSFADAGNAEDYAPGIAGGDDAAQEQLSDLRSWAARLEHQVQQVTQENEDLRAKNIELAQKLASDADGHQQDGSGALLDENVRLARLLNQTRKENKDLRRQIYSKLVENVYLAAAAAKSSKQLRELRGGSSAGVGVFSTGTRGGTGQNKQASDPQAAEPEAAGLPPHLQHEYHDLLEQLQARMQEARVQHSDAQRRALDAEEALGEVEGRYQVLESERDQLHARLSGLEEKLQQAEAMADEFRQRADEAAKDREHHVQRSKRTTEIHVATRNELDTLKAEFAHRVQEESDKMEAAWQQRLDAVEQDIQRRDELIGSLIAEKEEIERQRSSLQHHLDQLLEQSRRTSQRQANQQHKPFEQYRRREEESPTALKRQLDQAQDDVRALKAAVEDKTRQLQRLQEASRRDAASYKLRLSTSLAEAETAQKSAEKAEHTSHVQRQNAIAELERARKAFHSQREALEARVSGLQEALSRTQQLADQRLETAARAAEQSRRNIESQLRTAENALDEAKARVRHLQNRVAELTADRQRYAHELNMAKQEANRNGAELLQHQRMAAELQQALRRRADQLRMLTAEQSRMARQMDELLCERDRLAQQLTMLEASQ